MRRLLARAKLGDTKHEAMNYSVIQHVVDE